MVSVSTKLTLFVLVFPILLVSSLFMIGFYLYSANLDASSFFTAISSLLSAVLVTLLVWERLRDSCQKKLAWTHDNILFPLYKIFQEERPWFYYPEVEKLNEDLKRYGKFLIINLYPKTLLKDIKECIRLETLLHKDLEKITESAKKLGLTDRNMLFQFLNINPYRNRSAFSSDDPKIPEYQKGASLILKENPEVIDEIKKLDHNIVAMKKKITEKLEAFIKTNSLRLKEEPRYYPFHHYY